MHSDALMAIIAPLVWRFSGERLPALVREEIEVNCADRIAQDVIDNPSTDSIRSLEDPFRIHVDSQHDKIRIMTCLQRDLIGQGAEFKKASGLDSVAVSDVKKAIDGVARRRNFRSFVYGEVERLIDNGIEMNVSQHAVRDRSRLRFNLLVYEILLRDGVTEMSLRLLMVLTALCTPGGTMDQRASIMRNASAGPLHAFPHVLKRVYRDKLASVVVPSSKGMSDLRPYETRLKAIFPAQFLVQAARDYMYGPSFMESYLDPMHAPCDEHAKAYEALPDYLRLGQVFAPKGEVFRGARVSGYKFVEGTICCIGMLSLIELLLLQLKYAFAVSGGFSIRMYDLVERLAAKHGVLSGHTVAALQLISPRYELGVRDMVSHGAFVFRDFDKLRGVVAALSNALAGLLDDIDKLPLSDQEKVFSSVHGPCQLMQSTKDFLARQPKAQLELGPVEESAQRIGDLASDKVDHFRVSWMLWVEARKESTESGRHRLYGLLCAVIVLEHLLRSICFEGGMMLICLTAEPGKSIKCGFPMLDETPGNLLDPVNLSTVFGDNDDLRAALSCAKNIRNIVIHGRMCEIVGLEAECLEHLLKVAYSLARPVAPS